MLGAAIRFRQAIARFRTNRRGSGSSVSVIEWTVEGSMIRMKEGTLSFVIGAISMLRGEMILLKKTQICDLTQWSR